MTDEDFIELIWFTLMDVDLTDINYLAVDYDGEIIYRTKKLIPVNIAKNNIVAWRTEPPSISPYPIVYMIYLGITGR